MDAQGPPFTVSIRGSSLAYGASVRQTKKTKAWENYSLSGIANEIAGNAGLSCMYEAASDPTYPRKEQAKKSDITFLSELCHDEGISLKCTDGTLVLFDQSTYEAKPPITTIRRGGGRLRRPTGHTGRTRRARRTSTTACPPARRRPSTGPAG